MTSSLSDFPDRYETIPIQKFFKSSVDISYLNLRDDVMKCNEIIVINSLNRKNFMTTYMYTTSVPVFKQLLNSLRNILTKAEDYAAEKKIDPTVLLEARLYPDMFPLIRQVQIAADFAKGVSARLAGVEVPAFDDHEGNFTELKERIGKTLLFIESLTPAQFEGSETREIVLRPGTPKEKKLLGHAYLTSYGLPQFFFHVTSAYAILRHNGLNVGKGDYMGAF